LPLLFYKLYFLLFDVPKVLAGLDIQQRLVYQTDYVINIFFVDHLDRGMHIP